jgi:hypothetical protein
MAAIIFPAGPLVGQKFPANPGTSGVTQYQWDGSKWNAVTTTVSLGSPNQGAFNDYQWPAADGPVGRQLTTDGAGNLSWSATTAPGIQAIGLIEAIDGVSTTYTLCELGTGIFYSPLPPSNIVVFLGGVPQTPGAAYTISGFTITFAGPPLPGTTFYAISNIAL